jgi:hypothetical protein
MQKNVVDQIQAANEIFTNDLPNWRLANDAFMQLKRNDFMKAECCLLAVVSVDALYGTNLRYQPGLREAIARYLSSNWKWITSQSEGIDPVRLEKIARQFAKSSGVGPISFFSKFFHFFVSDDYPIFDALACNALVEKQHVCSADEVKPYSPFVETVMKFRQQLDHKFSVREIDCYLWLQGNWLQRNSGSWGKEKRKNEVISLFIRPNPEQRDRLNRLTAGEYGNYVI